MCRHQITAAPRSRNFLQSKGPPDCKAQVSVYKYIPGSHYLTLEKNKTNTNNNKTQTNKHKNTTKIFAFCLVTESNWKTFQIRNLQAPPKPAECTLALADKQDLLYLLQLLCWQGKGQAGKRHHWILSHKLTALLLFTNLWTLFIWNTKFPFSLFFHLKRSSNSFWLPTLQTYDPHRRGVSPGCIMVSLLFSLPFTFGCFSWNNFCYHSLFYLKP